METLWQDLKYGARQLARNPGFTAVAVLTLALGIGANTAIFSVLHAVFLRTLPYPEPERLMLVWGRRPAENNDRSQVSATDVADWRQQNNVFEDITTYGTWYPALTGTSDPERVPAVLVGDGYFEIMRIQPLLGRVFRPEENKDGRDLVVVLGYDLWQRRFGANPGIVGKPILLNGRPHTVVGVVPAGVRPLPASLVGNVAELYRPVGENPDERQRASRHLRALARLKPGVTLAEAQANMDVIAGRLEKEHPEYNTGYGVRVVPVKEDLVGGVRPMLWLLFGAVGFVLLIACANVANLTLARAATRQREMAIRAALGGGRDRLLRQLLTESILLALVGGGLGLLLAAWGTGYLESSGARVIPSLTSVTVNQSVLCFTLGVSVLTGLGFGLLPALRVSRMHTAECLKEGGRALTAGAQILRHGLVVSEVALALMLLVGAGLLIRSMQQLYRVDLGFQPDRLLTMNVYLPRAKYPKPEDWMQCFGEMLKRIEAVPGVEAAGLTSLLPLGSNFDGRGIQIEDQPRPRGQEVSVGFYTVTPGYLRATRISAVRGRLFTDEDRQGSQPVALVSETMARTLWPDRNPLGKRVRMNPIKPQPWYTVVGVVKDVRQLGLDEPGSMQLYFPQWQSAMSTMTLVVRAERDPVALALPVRNAIRSLDPDQTVFQLRTMDELLADSVALQRFSLSLLGAFAALAVALACIGLYGVMSFFVGQRSRELGIRMAMGALPSDILRLVLGRGARLAFVGIGLGLGASLALTRVLHALLFEVSPTDGWALSCAAILAASMTLLACYVPARRATRVDPMTALRYE